MIFMKSTIIFASFFKSGPIIITLTTNQLFKFQCSEKNFQRRFICYQLESAEKCIELFLKSFYFDSRFMVSVPWCICWATNRYICSHSQLCYLLLLQSELNVSITLEFCSTYIVTIVQQIVRNDLSKNSFWWNLNWVYQFFSISGPSSLVNKKLYLDKLDRSNPQREVLHHTEVMLPLICK